MKQPLVNIICFFLSISLVAQERLTAFTTEGTSNDNYLVDHNGQNYLLQVDQDNTLSVYKLLDPDTKEFLHSQVFEGFYDIGYKLEVKENYIIFSSGNEIIDYDYVNNIITSAQIPDGFISSSFINLINSTDNRFLVTVRSADPSETRGMIYEIGGTLYDLGPGVVHYMLGDDVMDSYYEGNNLRTIYFKNYLTNDVDTVARHLPFAQKPGQGDNVVYYFDKDGQVHSFDQTSRISSPLSGVKLDEIGNINSIMVTDDLIVLISPQTNGIDKYNIFQVYSLSSLTLENTFNIELDGPVYASRSFINDGVLTGLADTELLVLNLKTGEQLIRPTFYFWTSKFKVLQERYIINPHRVYSPTGWVTSFEWIDIQDLTVDSIEGEFNMIYTNFVGFSKFNDEYLVAYTYNNRDYQTIFTINVPDKKAQLNESLDNSNFGLPKESRVFTLGPEHYLLGSELYKINGDQLELIFAVEDIQEVNYEPIEIQNDKIVFVSDSPKKIYSYDGVTLVEEADLTEFQGSFFSNEIYRYLITDAYVLFSDFESRLYRYDKSDKSIIELTTHTFSNNGVLLNHNGTSYFSSGSFLFSTDSYNANLIMTNLNEGILADHNKPVIFEEELFVLTANGFARIVDDNTVDPITEDLELDLLSSFILDDTRNNMIVGDRISKVHYSNDTAYSFDLEYGEDYFGMGATDKLFFFKELNTTSGISTITFFNSETKEYGPLPDELQGYQVIEFFESGDDAYIMMSSVVNQNDILYLYKTNHSFTELTLVNEYLDIGGVHVKSLTRFESEAFLYTGNNLFIMDANYQLIPLDDVKGSGNATVIKQEDQAYFLAADPIYGRQLFKTGIDKFTDEDEDSAAEVEDIYLYPNPVRDFLNVEYNNLSSPIDKQYLIYDRNGLLVESGITSGLIPINHLNAGSYFLRVKDGDVFYSRMFSKQ